jgi:hypothetical protein
MNSWKPYIYPLKKKKEKVINIGFQLSIKVKRMMKTLTIGGERD